MKSLLRALLSLLFLVCLVVGVVASLLHPLSGQRHLALVRVTQHAGPPAPSGNNAPSAPSLTVRHQAVGVVNGQLLIGGYRADNEDHARRHVPELETTTLRPGLNPLAGPVRQVFAPGGVWTRGADHAFTLTLPLLWIAVAGLGIATAGYGSRVLYRLFTTERKPSAVCLHCNERFVDLNAEACPGCSAPRAKVTVTKIRRPI